MILTVVYEQYDLRKVKLSLFRKKQKKEYD